MPEKETKNVILYSSSDGALKLEVPIDGETVWLSQKQMAELFGCSIDNVSLHLKNVFAEGELIERATTEESSIVQKEGSRAVSRPMTLYNLDAIISVGYRINSIRGTQFRIWATDKLKEYIVKGFVLDDERLAEGKKSGYFDELVERIRAIRASERNFYQKITDIYATSVDYDARHPLTQTLFATVQNKVHYAIHGQTAAELIATRADSRQPNMGLTTWEGARIRKADVSIAKNYLNEEELRALNNLAEQYLIFAEGQAARRIAMTMQDWITKLEGFLTLNDREILQGAGKVSADLAKAHAEQEFDKFRVLDDHRFESDFDQMVKQLPAMKPK